MYGGEPPNWVYTTFAFVGFILASIPFPWHLEAWNTGTCLYMAWAAVGCLNGFINSIVWNKNVTNWAPVWCDISSRYIVGVSVGIPAASLCINRRLYLIASVQSVTTTKAEKRRAVYVDLAIGLGIPLAEMILQFIVQGHRFNIFEDVGCWPMTYNTPPAYPLVYLWPVCISMVSVVYCCLTIRTLAKRRADFNQMLAGNNNLNSSRYFRLMALASVELMLGIPWGVYSSLYLNLRGSGGDESPVQGWGNWDNVHSHFGYVGQFPAFEWKQTHVDVVTLELSRWSVIVCAFLFFTFFGFAQEARKNYRLAFNSVAKRVGYTTLGFQSGVSSSFAGTKQPYTSTTGRSTLPVFISQETTSKRDSYASFSTNLTLGDVGGALDDVKEPYSPADSVSKSTRYSFEGKNPSDVSPSHPPALTQPEVTFDPASPPRDSTDAPIVVRPDSTTLV